MTIEQRAQIAAAEQDYFDMLAATEIAHVFLCHSAQSPNGTGGMEFDEGNDERRPCNTRD